MGLKSKVGSNEMLVRTIKAKMAFNEISPDTLCKMMGWKSRNSYYLKMSNIDRLRVDELRLLRKALGIESFDEFI